MAEAERGRAETGLERVGARTGKGNYQERWSFRGGPALLLYPFLFVLFFSMELCTTERTRGVVEWLIPHATLNDWGLTTPGSKRPRRNGGARFFVTYSLYSCYLLSLYFDLINQSLPAKKLIHH